MKISEETVNVLSNFATINPAILVKEGSVLRTVSEARNVFADQDGDNKHYTMTVPKEPDQGNLFNDEDYAS